VLLTCMVDSYVRRKAWESTMQAARIAQFLAGGKRKRVSSAQMLGMMGVNL
jgi:hypothetical protein